MLHVASTLVLGLALSSSLPLAAAAAPPAAPVAGAPGTPGAPAPVPLPPDPVAIELATRFTAAVKCEPGKKDAGRHLCALTRIGKDPIWTPGQASTYLGVSIKVKPGADGKTDLKKVGAEPVSVAALHMAAASARVELLGAPSEAEKPKQQALLTDLQNQLKGDKKDAVVVPPELLGRLRDARKKPRGPLKLDKVFAEFAGPAPTRLYRADLAPVLGVTTGPVPVFVTVETAADGQQLSIFPASAIEK